MPFKIVLTLILALALSTLEISATTRDESTNMKDSIKFITEYKGIKEYQLKNGLKVVIKENNSIPLVTFSIWYKVGSRNETDGIRGLAHFLEHMMFKGTNKFKKGEISDTIQSVGGVFNAFTFSDGTAYYETVSPQYLEKMMEIESSRIKNSLLDKKELELEKNVVLSELEGDLNNPASLLDQKLRYEAYDKNPYKHPTIGYIDDIKNMTPEKMRDFYKSFYNPKNATIILIGDINEKDALALTNKHFGGIKNNESKDLEIKQDLLQTKEKRITVKKAGSTKLLEIAYHVSNAKSYDIYPLNIIEEILIKGNKSKLNEALIEKGLATEVSGGAEAYIDPGLFYIVVSITPDTKHETVEKIITKEINNLIKNPPSSKDITAAKNRIKAGYLFSLDGTYNQVVNLGFFEIINNWQQAVDWPTSIDKVNDKDVKNVLDKYFKNTNRTIGYFIPELKKGQKYENAPIEINKTHSLTGNKVKTKPEAKTKLNSDSFSTFHYEEKHLSDGSRLLLHKGIDIPITIINGAIKGGESLLPKSKEWECNFIASLLEKGSKNYTKEEIDDLLDFTGSQISFSCDEESFKFKIYSLNENLEKTIDLFTDLLLNPEFSTKELNKEKKKAAAEITELKDDTYEIAKRKLSQLVFSKDHNYYLDDFDNDIKAIKKITRQDLVKSHELIIKNNRLLASFLTNIEDSTLNKVINKIEKSITLKTEKLDRSVIIPDTKINDSPLEKITYIHDKPQSDVFLGHAGLLKRTDPDFYKVYVANHILGGSALTSRLAKNVRDNSGLVYTVLSYLDASLGEGEFGIYFGANNQNVDKAIKIIKDQLDLFVKFGISEDELNKAKKSIIDSFISRNLSTYSNIGNTILAIEFYGLGKNYVKNYPNTINSITLNDANKTIKKYFHPKKLNLSIAGEYKKNEKP